MIAVSLVQKHRRNLDVTLRLLVRNAMAQGAELGAAELIHDRTTMLNSSHELTTCQSCIVSQVMLICDAMSISLDRHHA